MLDFLELCFTDSNVVVSGLVIFILAFWLISMIGGFGLDTLDVDMDVDVDVDGVDSILGIGMIPLRWLNVGAVPLMLWLTIFGLTWWAISLGFYVWFDNPNWGNPAEDQGWIITRWDCTWALSRNLAIALIPTKLFTQPLIGVFTDESTNTPEELLGRVGIAKLETTPDQGQISLTLDGVGLVLDIRTEEDQIAAGTRVVIRSYDSARRVFIVEISEPDDSNSDEV